MKTRLLVGLVAVALGGLTSCGNILEENGVINNVAESGMGELRINLTTDASLNVSTKSGGTETTKIVKINEKEYTIDLDKFNITAQPSNTQNSIVSGKPSEFPKLVAADNYNVTATLDQMNNESLNWNTPSFSGSGNATVTQAGEGKASITATLSNSIIAFNLNESNDNFTSKEATIKEVYVYKKGSEENKKYLYKNKEGFEAEGTLFVAAEQTDIYIHINGILKNGTPIDYSSLVAGRIVSDGVQDKTQTYAANVYNIKYNIVTESGTLALVIDVSGNATPVPLDVDINPYE